MRKCWLGQWKKIEKEPVFIFCQDWHFII